MKIPREQLKVGQRWITYNRSTVVEITLIDQCVQLMSLSSKRSWGNFDFNVGDWFYLSGQDKP